MKKQKIKRILKFQQKFIILLILFLGIGIGYIFAADFAKIQIATQTSSGDREIEIKSSSGAYYVNNRNNSAIINNYFEGYYFDKIYGVFKLDWSSDKNQNVRVINGTNKCSTGYGYNLGGKAKSENAGYIDFAGVYYCLDDGKLHGKGYSKFAGYQDFEGISFNIITKAEAQAIIDSDTNNFVNDSSDTNVIKKEKLTGNDSKTSNAGDFKLGGEEFYIEDDRESIFYIIK